MDRQTLTAREREMLAWATGYNVIPEVEIEERGYNTLTWQNLAGAGYVEYVLTRPARAGGYLAALWAITLAGRAALAAEDT